MKFKLIFGLAVMVLILVVWLARTKEGPAEDVIKIGVVVPLTGPAAHYGESERDGISLAVKEINESGGILGKKLEVILEDDSTDPKKAVSSFNKLVSVDKVAAVIGGAWDFLANATIPVADQNKKIFITPSALPDTLNSQSPYVFMVHAPVADSKDEFVRFLSNYKQAKVVVLQVNTVWGNAYASAFKEAIVSTGSTLSGEFILPHFDNNDFLTELVKIKELHPDVVMVAVNYADTSVFLKRRKELKLPGAVLIYEQEVKDGLMDKGITFEEVEGVMVYGFSPSEEKFVTRYQAEYNDYPGQYADTAYDSVHVLKMALENAGGDIDSDKLIDGLHKVNNYPGASGLIDFSESNYPHNKKVLIQVFKDGRFERV
jgi:branched-chain amino acid transport system substrate-binding protein